MFETVFVNNNKDFFFFLMFLGKLFSSSDFDDTTLIILLKECLIDGSSIFLFLEEFLTIFLQFSPCVPLINLRIQTNYR